MISELQIKAHLLDLESKVDKNGNFYYRLSLQGIPGYYYAFNYNLPELT
jgi:RNA binding exosome subunit